MKISDFVLGQRVRRRGDESSFVRDRPIVTGARRIGIIVTSPERVNSTHYSVTVQWEGSSLREEVLIHRLEPLPIEEQPQALGGSWVAKPDTFVARKTTP